MFHPRKGPPAPPGAWRVKREVIPDDTPSGAQGWFFNTRRAKFKDKRLREAFIDAFDFEWTNKAIMCSSARCQAAVYHINQLIRALRAYKSLIRNGWR